MSVRLGSAHQQCAFEQPAVTSAVVAKQMLSIHEIGALELAGTG